MTNFLREVRPALPAPVEVRFETPPVQRAQINFARFIVTFTNEPSVTHINNQRVELNL